MRRKVLLVTLWGNKNFGNRLQALALKKMIEKLGYDVTCAAYKSDTIKKTIIKIPKALLGLWGITKYRNTYLSQCRVHAIKKGKKLYYPQTRTITHYKTKRRIDPNSFEAAVVGSDQVWHHWGKEDDLPYFYLSFMPPQKRISYAASFGFEEFPQKDLRFHTEGLKGMRYISCREETGCKLVKEITGKQGELVLDPTLCIDRVTWIKYEKAPQYKLPQRYMLVFMLGEKNNYWNAIESYAQKNKLEIIDLFDYKRRDVWTTTIEGFLWIVHHAEYVCTDSFHCIVFSILFGRKFTAFHRQQKGFENMFDRIATLLSITGLQANEYNGTGIQENSFNYVEIRNELEKSIYNSMDWLKTALNNVCKKEID